MSTLKRRTVESAEPSGGGTKTLELGAPPTEEIVRRRARAAERQRAATELKRSRAAQRRGSARYDRAVREHRSSLLVMVILLGLLIATVVVSGGLIAASMRTRPVDLAAPLHIYPVTQTVPGQCPAGTQGITGQSSSGLACYQLSQGIAIRKVADLRVQRSRNRTAYDVAVTLRANDRRAFATLTRATLNRDLAFVVRDRLVTVPRVDTPILDGKVVITGPPNRAEANRLVRSLRGR
ncbi:SecDF P1 head subdomain-containing protein [Spirillospora sp. CA-255316]